MFYNQQNEGHLHGYFNDISAFLQTACTLYMYMHVHAINSNLMTFYSFVLNGKINVTCLLFLLIPEFFI